MADAPHPHPHPHPHIVIIGAGFGGLAAARGLRRLDAQVTIIDRQNHHLFQPLLYQVATAGLSPAEIAAPIRAIVRRYRNTRVLLDTVTGVDSAARTIALESGTTLDYDALIIATGATHSYFGQDHWAEFAPGIKTIDDAIQVRARILVAMERAETERQQMPETRDQQLTFVVIGGGPTGVEMAGAIAELTRHAADMDFRYISRQCIRVMLVEAGPRLLGAFPDELSTKALIALEQLGVEVRLNGRVTDIEADAVMVGDERVAAAAIIWGAGVQASPAAKWLGVEADRAGRVIVASDMQVADRPGVYAIGDTASVADKDGRPVPGVAPAAKQQGEHVARVIAASVKGTKHPGPFAYKNYGNLATIGRRRAVADFGWTRLSGWPAWFVWSTAHIFYLTDFRSRLIVGAQWIWSYVTFDRGARLITGISAAKMPHAVWSERQPK
ncbi:MAG: NAD(P)/FAD-dependent oxidoreductase [Sphingomonas sp.]|nr:NAD(P)/FAD-dependent oxidoreductase [Sphingomonas sp.]